MENKNLYEQAQLLTAGIRIYEHFNKRPPDLRELATFLRLAPEKVAIICKNLESNGIVGFIKSGSREALYIKDHKKIEDLPRDDSGEGIENEISKLKEMRSRHMGEIEKRLHAGDQKSEKFKDLEKALKNPAVTKKNNPLDSL